MTYTVRFGNRLGMMNTPGSFDEKEFNTLKEAYRAFYNASQGDIEYTRLIAPDGTILADYMNFYSETEGGMIREGTMSPQLRQMLEQRQTPKEGNPFSYKKMTDEAFQCIIADYKRRNVPFTRAIQAEMQRRGMGNPGNPQEKPWGLWQSAGGSENEQISQRVAEYLRGLGYIVNVHKDRVGPPGYEYDYWSVYFDVPASMPYQERVRKGDDFWRTHDQIIKRMFAQGR